MINSKVAVKVKIIIKKVLQYFFTYFKIRNFSYE